MTSEQNINGSSLAEAMESQSAAGFCSNPNGFLNHAECMEHSPLSIPLIITHSVKTLDGFLPDSSNLDGPSPISVTEPESTHVETLYYDHVVSSFGKGESSSPPSIESPDDQCLNQQIIIFQQQGNDTEIDRVFSPMKIDSNSPSSSKPLSLIDEDDDDDDDGDGDNTLDEEEGWRPSWPYHDHPYHNPYCSRSGRFHSKFFNLHAPEFHDHNCIPHHYRQCFPRCPYWRSKSWDSRYRSREDRENRVCREYRSRCVSLPVEELIPTGVGAGLTNLGNTCFINAVLQCFTHTVPLVEALRSCNHASPCGSDGFCVLCTFRDHIELSLASSGMIVSPSKLVDNLSYISSCFQRYQQEDAHEFLQCLLDRLERCCSNTNVTVESSSQENIVERVFGGRLVSKLRCCNCGYCSDKYEPLIDLSLEIENVDTLYQALESFTKVEKIEDPESKFTCENCEEEVSREKQLMLDQAPSVAAFHLKRFKTDGSSVEKIGKHVEFPLELDLKPYTACADTDAILKYQLYAIVVHNGFLPTSGHYFCYIRSCPETWHKLDDSTVGKCDEEFVLSRAAYILFYARDGTPWSSSLIESQKLCLNSRNSNSSPKSVLESVECVFTSYHSTTNIDSCEASVTRDVAEQRLEDIHISHTRDDNEGIAAHISCRSTHGETNILCDESRGDIPMVDLSLQFEASDGPDDMLHDDKLSALHSEEHISSRGADDVGLNALRPPTPTRSVHLCTNSGRMPEHGYQISRDHLKVENRCKRSPGKTVKDLERKEAFRYLKKNMPFSRSMKLMAAMLPCSDKKRRLRSSPKKASPRSRRKLMHHMEVVH